MPTDDNRTKKRKEVWLCPAPIPFNGKCVIRPLHTSYKFMVVHNVHPVNGSHANLLCSWMLTIGWYNRPSIRQTDELKY